jgi:hypothetical protein
VCVAACVQRPSVKRGKKHSPGAESSPEDPLPPAPRGALAARPVVAPRKDALLSPLRVQKHPAEEEALAEKARLDPVNATPKQPWMQPTNWSRVKYGDTNLHPLTQESVNRLEMTKRSNAYKASPEHSTKLAEDAARRQAADERVAAAALKMLKRSA